MENSKFTKKELIKWVKEKTGIKILRIQELGNGAIFCKLLDKCFCKVPMNKINWQAHLEHENLINLKILSTSMYRGGIEKKFDDFKIAKFNYLHILELLQWFRSQSDKNIQKIFTVQKRSLSLGGKRQTTTQHNKVSNIKIKINGFDQFMLNRSKMQVGKIDKTDNPQQFIPMRTNGFSSKFRLSNVLNENNSIKQKSISQRTSSQKQSITKAIQKNKNSKTNLRRIEDNQVELECQNEDGSKTTHRISFDVKRSK